MMTLYGLFLLLLLGTLGLLLIPFIKQPQGHLPFLLLAFIFTAASCCIYGATSDTHALRLWFAKGQQHYELLVKLEQLGGMDGIIQRISKRLQADPTDAQGWMILGKLYAIKHNYPAAADALRKAHTLDIMQKPIKTALQS